MANWKKMAEAFGGAMADPGSSREGRALIKRDERQARFDERTERHTDDALAKEWDDAFKQSTDKFKSQSSALTDEDADAWKSELLRTIDVLRKRGFSDADILNTIKGK